MLARQAEQLRLPDSAFAPGEDRPGLVLLDLRQLRHARRRRAWCPPADSMPPASRAASPTARPRWRSMIRPTTERETCRRRTNSRLRRQPLWSEPTTCAESGPVSAAAVAGAAGTDCRRRGADARHGAVPARRSGTEGPRRRPGLRIVPSGRRIIRTIWTRSRRNACRTTCSCFRRRRGPIRDSRVRPGPVDGRRSGGPAASARPGRSPPIWPTRNRRPAPLRRNRSQGRVGDVGRGAEEGRIGRPGQFVPRSTAAPRGPGHRAKPGNSSSRTARKSNWPRRTTASGRKSNGSSG